MTADNRYYRNKSEHIRIHKESRKAVLKYDKLDDVDVLPRKLKLNTAHQKNEADYSDYGSSVNYKFADLIQLRFGINVFLRLHTVEYEEAYADMKEHNDAVNCPAKGES